MGENSSGNLGIGNNINQYTPFVSMSNVKIKSIVCGESHTLALMSIFFFIIFFYSFIVNLLIKIENQELFSTGSNQFGALCMMNKKQKLNKFTLALRDVISVFAGSNHSIIWKSKKTLKNIFKNSFLISCLGEGNSKNLIAYGRNNFGQLGVGNSKDQQHSVIYLKFPLYFFTSRHKYIKKVLFSVYVRIFLLLFYIEIILHFSIGH